MYSQMLKNNFENICTMNEGLDLLRQIEKSKKVSI